MILYNNIKKFYKSIVGYIDYKKLANEEKELIIYSEGKEYWPHLKDIYYALKKSKVNIKYITSDLNESSIINDEKNVFYIGKGILRTLFFQTLNTKYCLLTMPDLNSFHIKKSINVEKYIYIFHSAVSTHMAYRSKAFNSYDLILCAGPHHLEEIKKNEEKYYLKKKILIEYGYSRLDIIMRKKNKIKNSQSKSIVIAPTWGKNNITNIIGSELISMLLNNSYKVFFRPHPKSLIDDRKTIVSINKKFSENNNYFFDDNVDSEDSLYKSDIMLTDWSGVALDFSFGLEKPVVFFNVPKKINNPSYNEINIRPFEEFIRKELGAICEIKDIKKINQILIKLYKNNKAIKDSIKKARSKWIYNVGNSSDKGLKDLLRHIKK